MGGMRDRLLREAQALARLAHPNVVAVHDVGTFGHDVFIAMEFVEGQTLRAWMKAEPRGQREITEAFVAAGQGLAAAHRAGLVHRDFKPDNVIVGSDGRVRVLDFGIARDATTGAVPSDDDLLPGATPSRSPVATTGITEALPPPSSSPTPSGPSLAVPLTRHGTILGTPRYMAPEQHLGELADARAESVQLLRRSLRGPPRRVSLRREGRGCAEGGGAARAGTRAARGVARAAPRPSALAARSAGGARRPARVDERAAGAAGPRPPRPDAVARRGRADARPRAGRIVAGPLARTRAGARAALPGGSARLAGVWDDAVRARVRGALLATREPYAQDAWANVEKTIDRYAARWTQMHRDTCEATQLRGEQTGAVMTLRMACLDRKLQGISALVNVLGEADSAMLQKAGAAAAGLASLQECADAAGLLGEASPPSDPELRRRIEDVRAGLSRAEALRLAGRIPDAVALSSGVADARATGDDAVLAEAPPRGGTRDATTSSPSTRRSCSPSPSGSLREPPRPRGRGRRHGAARGYALSEHPEDAACWDQLAQSGLQRHGGRRRARGRAVVGEAARAIELHRYDDELQADLAGRAAERAALRHGRSPGRSRSRKELTRFPTIHAYESWQRRLALFERQERQLRDPSTP